MLTNVVYVTNTVVQAVASVATNPNLGWPEAAGMIAFFVMGGLVLIALFKYA